MLNMPITMNAQRTLAFFIFHELARYLKTTILKIGKSNFRFSKNALDSHLKRDFEYVLFQVEIKVKVFTNSSIKAIIK